MPVSGHTYSHEQPAHQAPEDSLGPEPVSGPEDNGRSACTSLSPCHRQAVSRRPFREPTTLPVPSRSGVPPESHGFLVSTCFSLSDVLTHSPAGILGAGPAVTPTPPFRFLPPPLGKPLPQPLPPPSGATPAEAFETGGACLWPQVDGQMSEDTQAGQLPFPWVPLSQRSAPVWGAFSWKLPCAFSSSVSRTLLGIH